MAQITRARAQLIRNMRNTLQHQTKKNFDWKMFLSMKALLNKHKQEAARKRLSPHYFADINFDRYMEALRLKRSYHADLRVIAARERAQLTR